MSLTLQPGLQIAIPYDTVQFDNFNKWDSTNYRYVFPLNGVYSVIANVRITGITINARHILNIFTNGSDRWDSTEEAWGTSTLYPTLKCCALVNANANDYVDIQLVHYGTQDITIHTGAPDYTFLCVSYIGTL